MLVAASSGRVFQSLSADAYVTDGTRLFRVTGRCRIRGPGSSAQLEDCVTLAQTSYRSDELDAMRFERVGASRDG